MKAIQFNEYGGPEVLHLVEVDEPHAGSGQVRIRARASGVDPSDWKRRKGMYRAFEEVAFPAGVGVEASGVIDEIGQGVRGYSVAMPCSAKRTFADDHAQPNGKGWNF